MSATAFAGDKILLVATSHSMMGNTHERTGLWLSELTHPYDVFKDAGFDVDIVSIEGGPVPIDPRSLAEDNEDRRAFLADSALMAALYTTPALADVNPDDYRAVFFSGGHGTMWDFPGNTDVNRVAGSLYDQGGVVAAVCHGPAALTDIRLADGSLLLAGRKVTGFTNEEESIMELTAVVPFALQTKLEAQGADFAAATPWSDHVVTDERLVTGQNPQSAAHTAQTVVELLRR